MKALILAAGLGTRLHPFTADRPKALVTVGGVTLLERAIRKVSEIPLTEIIINIHHFGDQIISFLDSNHHFNLPVSISDERDFLLDTGGAMRKAHALLGDQEPFLVYNADVFSAVDLMQLVGYHNEKQGLATLVVRRRSTDRYLVFNSEMQLSGWKNLKTGEHITCREERPVEDFAFSGIALVQPAIFPLMTETGKFSAIPMYLRLAAQEPVFGYLDTSPYWMDLGKPAQLTAAEKLLSTR